jgi:hypothetical protein
MRRRGCSGSVHVGATLHRVSSPPPDAPHTGSEPEWQPPRDAAPAAVLSTPTGRVAVLIANVGKLAGIVFGTLEAIGPARPPAMLFWVALFLGAQAFEDLLRKIVDQATGR